MPQNNRIKVSELDFDGIKQNLKSFLQGQDEFSDYNYEGSALSVLLDVLAYNTHYNALYTNMSVNEMFLDSASKRSSVVSIANNFGYTPRSSRSAKAILSFRVAQNSIQGTQPSNLIIPKNTTFSAQYNTDIYMRFKTLEDYVSSTLTNGYYYFNNVSIYEGTYRSVIFICSSLNQKFVIPYKNIDTSTLSVRVQKTTETADTSPYFHASSIADLTPNSKVFFLKELDTEEYELTFGRNNLGLPIEAGNVITISFMEPEFFDKANGLKYFNLNELSFNPGTIEATLIASGGSLRESNEEIKDNVTRFFFNQNRAVTSKDYSAIVTREYPDVDSVFVWGGENETPPQYGKVFISLKPKSKNTLSDSEKELIKQIIQPYQVVSSIIEFKDPSFINMKLDITTTYDKSSSSRTAEELRLDIKTIIEQYRQNNLQKHDGVFSLSKIMTLVSDIDLSIISTDIKHTAIIDVTPVYNSMYNYIVNFNNEIDSSIISSVVSSSFFIKDSTLRHFVESDQNGNLRLIKINSSSNTNEIVNYKVGTIDYNTGLISINGLNIIRIDGEVIKISIKPKNFDVFSKNNTIIDIPTSLVSIVMKDKQYV